MKNKSACFFVLSLFVCSMFTSCNKESTTECQTIDFSTLFDGQPEKIPLKEWAKSIHFVQLETNDSVLIGNIRATILHKDKILVHHNNLSLLENDIHIDYNMIVVQACSNNCHVAAET